MNIASESQKLTDAKTALLRSAVKRRATKLRTELGPLLAELLLCRTPAPVLASMGLDPRPMTIEEKNTAMAKAHGAIDALLTRIERAQATLQAGLTSAESGDPEHRIGLLRNCICEAIEAMGKGEG